MLSGDPTEHPSLGGLLGINLPSCFGVRLTVQLSKIYDKGDSVPFRDANNQGSFDATALSILQRAFDLSCEALKCKAESLEEQDRLARIVIRYFEAVGPHPELIARKIAEDNAYSPTKR